MSLFYFSGTDTFQTQPQLLGFDSHNAQPFTMRYPRKHVCKICGKRFPDVSALRRHTRVHTGERPYPCTLCEKRFSQKEHMKSHMMVHYCPSGKKD